MPQRADRESRGLRVQEVQAEIGEENAQFCDRLNRTAAELGVASKWYPVRLSRIRNGMQDMTIEDMTVLARIDPKQRGWTWIAYGMALSKGEDAYAALARMAKKEAKRA